MKNKTKNKTQTNTNSHGNQKAYKPNACCHTANIFKVKHFLETYRLICWKKNGMMYVCSDEGFSIYMYQLGDRETNLF